MNVYLTFDIEVWCNGWKHLDENFPSSFDRYVYGRSAAGEWALPKTLEILNRHGLHGVFFVESLFAARFGMKPLETIVRLIRDAGQEVQQHLHAEWTDEAVEPLIPNCAMKRQHLSFYDLDEQTALIGHGRRLLEAAGSGPITAFRAGSFAADRNTFEALSRNGIRIDSSLNRCHAVSAPELRDGRQDFDRPFEIGDVLTLPVSVFRDGFGRDRPAQVGACSASELRAAMKSAAAQGHRHFVIVSHNFEMLRSGSSQPDWVVARRFEQLCAFLAQQRGRFTVRGFDAAVPRDGADATGTTPRAGFLPTARRHAEQIQRRLRR